MVDRITLVMPPAESVGMTFRPSKDLDVRHMVLLMDTGCKIEGCMSRGHALIVDGTLVCTDFAGYAFFVFCIVG